MYQEWFLEGKIRKIDFGVNMFLLGANGSKKYDGDFGYSGK